MGNNSHDAFDTWSGKTAAATQRHEAAYLPWPATSCVSSPCANRAGTLQEFQAPDPAEQRSPEQLLTGPADCGNPEATFPQCAVPRGQPTVPLGCILVDPQRASPARHHDNYKGAPGPLVPSAEKENSPSPERAHWCLHATAAPTQTQAPRNDMADIDCSGNEHREVPLRQPLQQASMLQADMLMQDATPLVTSKVAQGTSIALKAPGTPAHHSLQLPAPSNQYQHLKQRPASAQAHNVPATAAKQAVKAWGMHAAPEECDPLLTRFAWNLDQKGHPDSIAHLQSSGIFPDQGPLGMGQEALQQLSYSSSASGASMARRAQRIEDEAMLYLSHSSSNDSARMGKPEGDLPLYPSHQSSDSSAHPFHIGLDGGMPRNPIPCAAGLALPGGPLQAQTSFEGFLHTEADGLPESLIRSSCISAMPWDLSRRNGPAAHVPTLPRHLATPSLMERAGDPAFYDEPELGRTTPPTERPFSQFTLAEKSEHLPQRKPSRAKLPPLPAHLKSMLTPPGAKQGSRATLQALPAGCIKDCPEPAPTSCPVPSKACHPANALHAAVLQQAVKPEPAESSPGPAVPTQALNQTQAVDAREAAMSAIRNGQFKLKPATPSPAPAVSAQAPEQTQAVGAHEAAMSAIRQGQFKLKPDEKAAGQTPPAADARDALVSAIKSGHFTLKPASPATVPIAGAESRSKADGQASGGLKLASTLGGLHALLRQRLGPGSESSSNGTEWEA